MLITHPRSVGPCISHTQTLRISASVFFPPIADLTCPLKSVSNAKTPVARGGSEWRLIYSLETDRSRGLMIMTQLQTTINHSHTNIMLMMILIMRMVVILILILIDGLVTDAARGAVLPV